MYKINIRYWWVKFFFDFASLKDSNKYKLICPRKVYLQDDSTKTTVLSTVIFYWCTGWFFINQYATGILSGSLFYFSRLIVSQICCKTKDQFTKWISAIGWTFFFAFASLKNSNKYWIICPRKVYLQEYGIYYLYVIIGTKTFWIIQQIRLAYMMVIMKVLPIQTTLS